MARALVLFLLFFGFTALAALPADATPKAAPEKHAPPPKQKPAAPAKAAPAKQTAMPTEMQRYREAFRLLNSGKTEAAYNMTLKLRDPVINKIVRSYYMGNPGNNTSFTELAAFLRDDNDWPNARDVRAIAEQKIPASASGAEVVEWFRKYPPVTYTGICRYIDAMYMNGQQQAATDFIRKRWIEGDFRDDDLSNFYTRYGAFLSRNDHWARTDHLLWDLNGAAAKRVYPLIDPGMRAVGEARLALAGQKFNAIKLLNMVPAELQSEPGLLYERLRWLRRNNRDEDANDILKHAPDELGRPEAWWEERHIMIRRAMEKRNFDLAYRLAARHGQVENRTLLQAEFLAGWLALRFLNQPEAARDHFETLAQRATTPISRARGSYWLARALEATGDKSEAEQAYESAAALNITFYGQLAMARIYSQPVVSATPEPAIPASVRAKFHQYDLIRAVDRLHDLGENTRMRSFFRAAMDAADTRADFALLSELAYEMQRPDLAIETAKAANQKNFLVAAGGFPVLERNIPRPPEPAFVNAIVRQESMFNPDAQSPVGAHGLMQLMPATAKGVARNIGVKYTPSRLGEPDYNLRLGATFMQSQIDSFNGSYILALAGYNAGPSRVRDWMEQIGDPRNTNIDPIDWIELIPVAETRNYVQRILENLQIYRARLNGGKAPLNILRDLKR